LTPVIYLVEARIERYLGRDVAKSMKRAAMGQKEDEFMNIPAAG
jgi:queuosine precursor transporter